MAVNFKAFLARPAIVKAWRTFLQSFLGLFLISLVGWLNNVVMWANDSNGHLFPSVSVLTRAGIAAMASAVIAVVTLVHNGAENATGATLPGVPKV